MGHEPFFREVRSRLGEHGVFCLWLPMYQMDAATAGVVARTFRDEFPCALAVRGNLDPVAPIVGLVGSAAPFDLSDETLAERLGQVKRQARAVAAGQEAWQKQEEQTAHGVGIESSPFLRSPAHLRLAIVGDLHAASVLDHWPANTDDRPVIAFLAPEAAQAPSTLRGIKLLEWCDANVPAHEFPSCRMGAAGSEDDGPKTLKRGDAGGRDAAQLDAHDTARGDESLRNSALAGANYFAAAVMSVPLPHDEKEAERAARVEFHLGRAQTLAPTAVLGSEDLGR